MCCKSCEEKEIEMEQMMRIISDLEDRIRELTR